MKKSIIILILVSSILLIAGCTRTAKFGIIGTRNIDYSASYERSDLTQVKNEFVWFLIFPISTDILHPMEVIDLALEKGGYEFLTDAEIKDTRISLLFGLYLAMEVRGTGWKKVGGHASLDIDNKPILVYSENNELKLTSELPPELLEEIEAKGLLVNP